MIGTALPTAMLLACATDDATSSAADPPASAISPPDSGVAADAADADASVEPCDDCEYFPSTCTAGVLCPSGPFDPTTRGGAFDPRTRVDVIRGRSAHDVWAGGGAGSLAHFDGTSWARSESGTQESLNGIWLREEDEVTFARLDLLHTRGIDVPDAGVSDGGWTQQSPTVATLYERSRVTFEGAGWSTPDAEWFWAGVRPTSTSFDRPNSLWRLHRTSSGEFEVAAAITDVFQYPMTSVHGSSADVLWAVGDDGMAVRITGAQGAEPAYAMFNTQTVNGLRGVWVASESEAWAVGGAGTIRHYTGDSYSWEIVGDVPTTEHLRAVWGTSRSDVWAVGNGAIVLHYDGAQWSRVKVAGLGVRRPDLYTVWTATPGHVWIGGHGVLLSVGGIP